MSKLSGNRYVHLCSRLRRGASIHHFSVCLSDGVYFRNKALLLVARVPLFIRKSRQNLSRRTPPTENRQLGEKRESLQMSLARLKKQECCRHDAVLQTALVRRFRWIIWSKTPPRCSLISKWASLVGGFFYLFAPLRLLTSFPRLRWVFCAVTPQQPCNTPATTSFTPPGVVWTAATHLKGAEAAEGALLPSHEVLTALAGSGMRKDLQFFRRWFFCFSGEKVSHLC